MCMDNDLVLFNPPSALLEQEQLGPTLSVDCLQWRKCYSEKMKTRCDEDAISHHLTNRAAVNCEKMQLKDKKDDYRLVYVGVVKMVK